MLITVLDVELIHVQKPVGGVQDHQIRERLESLAIAGNIIDHDVRALDRDITLEADDNIADVIGADILPILLRLHHPTEVLVKVDLHLVIQVIVGTEVIRRSALIFQTLELSMMLGTHALRCHHNEIDLRLKMYCKISPLSCQKIVHVS